MTCIEKGFFFQIKSNSDLDKLYQHLIQVTEGCPAFHIETQLLFKVPSKGYVPYKPTNQVAYHLSLIIKS